MEIDNWDDKISPIRFDFEYRGKQPCARCGFDTPRDLMFWYEGELICSFCRSNLTMITQ